MLTRMELVTVDVHVCGRKGKGQRRKGDVDGRKFYLGTGLLVRVARKKNGSPHTIYIPNPKRKIQKTNSERWSRNGAGHTYAKSKTDRVTVLARIRRGLVVARNGNSWKVSTMCI